MSSGMYVQGTHAACADTTLAFSSSIIVHHQELSSTHVSKISTRPISHHPQHIPQTRRQIASCLPAPSSTSSSSIPPSLPPPSSSATSISTAIANGNDVLILGRGSSGRVSAILSGAQARDARAVLIIAPAADIVSTLSSEARHSAWTERVVSAAKFRAIDGWRDPGGAVKRAGSKPVVVIGTETGVGDAFFADGKSARWVSRVEVLVLYDVRAIIEQAAWKTVRKIVRAATMGGAQVVAVVSSVDEKGVEEYIGLMRPEFTERIDWGDEGMEGLGRDVPQRVATVAPRMLVLALREVVVGRKGRVVVFFQTARMAQWFAALFREMGLEINEAHSALTEAGNARNLDDFRITTEDSVLFSSDALSRGVDFAHCVEHVVQVGLPRNEKQYLERLREIASSGTCLTLLLGYELDAFFLRNCTGGTVSEKHMRAFAIKGLGEREMDAEDERVFSSAFRRVGERLDANAYAAWLKAHQASVRDLGWSQEYLVKRGWQWATDVARLKRPPVLPVRIVDKMGLNGVPGMLVDEGPDAEEMRRNPVRVPDHLGKLKKRKPMGRWSYSPEIVSVPPSETRFKVPFGEEADVRYRTRKKDRKAKAKERTPVDE